ncbi:MAG: Fe-S cluster assembly protein SufD [Hyphomicrobiaceae bacterium]|nr:Fe-S cluster assembly protein SufD [Hyphomicrobiaceae bacterium]
MNVAVMKTKAETGFTEGFERVVDTLPGGPNVAALRREAIGQFAADGLPHRRVEEWKYTDLRNVMKDALPPAIGDATRITIADVIVALGPLGRMEVPRVVLVNGSYRKELSNTEAAAGVSVVALSTLLAGGADAKVFGVEAECARQSVVALNTAYATDGVVVDVPDGVTLEAPVFIVHVRAGGVAQFAASRNRVRVGKGARATIVEVFAHVPGATPDGQQSAVTAVDLDEGGQLAHIKIVNDAGRITHLSNWDVTLAKSADYRAFHYTAGAGLARNQMRVVYAGANAKADISGAFLARVGEHVDTTLLVDHALPGGVSRELFKGVLQDHARGVFQGKVIVRPDAQKTDGKQMAQALMLSEDAEFDSKPELEIYADDVVCGHGSTSAALDTDLLFYLRARGIPLEAARALLIQSFVGEAIDKVENPSLRDALMEQAQIWLLGHEA